MDTPTPKQIDRVTKDWGKIAGEAIEISFVGGELYAFGSELACLRLEHHMRTGRAEYIKNVGWSYNTHRE